MLTARDSELGQRLARDAASTAAETAALPDRLAGSGISATTTPCPDNARCLADTSLVVLLPEQGMALGATATSRQVEAILVSLEILPAGLTTVPYLAFGTSSDDGISDLERAGLVGRRPAGFEQIPHYVTGTSPAPGTVVQIGSTVDVRIGDG